MVCTSEKKRTEREGDIPSSRPLQIIRTHSRLKWGHQKQLRCIKVLHDPSRSPTVSNPTPNSTGPFVDHHEGQATSSIPIPQKSPVAATRKNVKTKSPISTSTPVYGVTAGDTLGIGAVREKLTSDLKMSEDPLKLQILEEQKKDSNNNNKPSKEVQQRVLRPRGPSGKVSNEVGIGNVGLFPLNYTQERGLSSLLASDKGAGRRGSREQQPKLPIALSKEEIETDFLLMTGDIQPVKPKRRSKALQKQLHKLLPGSSLVDVRSWTDGVPDHLHEPKAET